LGGKFGASTSTFLIHLPLMYTGTCGVTHAEILPAY
jgi:hypothetical protein